jgi:biotin synthase
MSWKISPGISEILKKGADWSGIDSHEAMELMHLDLYSREVYALMQTAAEMSRQQFGAKGENHFHIGLNVEPCPFNCLFCSLTETAGIFKESIEFSMEEVLAWARLGEENHADALNLMTTGTYTFQKLLELGRFLKARVSVLYQSPLWPTPVT